MEPINNTADTADMMEIDEQSTPMRPTLAAAANVQYDQEMLDAEALIMQGGRGAEMEEADEDKHVAGDADYDEDPLADLEAAAARDDLPADGDLGDVLTGEAAAQEDPPVFMHIVEKTGSKFIPAEYDPNAIQVTVDYNHIVARIADNVARPNLDTVHLAQGLSDEEILLGHVAHPDDIAGSLLLRLAPTLSTMELAERVNALYHCCKLQLNSNNAFTQRIALAGDALGRRNGWSKQQTTAEKIRVKNLRPNAHSTAIPVRQYTFLNRPAGGEAEEKTRWIKPQMRKDAGPDAKSLSSRNRKSTARAPISQPPPQQPVPADQADDEERAAEEPSDNEEAFTDEQIEAGQAHHDSDLAALYKKHAEQKEEFAELERQLREKEDGDDV
ncbi:uncharacterized protein MYCFIDRAFT_77211 [Pseudocercospora fijiensis CIRAD86]|uniref:Uncharacterized protein n=1 Tax=Pseudocercospora fijiensis (strain CIRAD86) TaxID=383855 RepID=M3A7D3_PSEFD|nr:uncharacterized protein MYCFIDRAFT_77211 [Pseudocercospora fijiensis CIRAD86]EME86999.1 hypothetical protein MYCFIDRAFT_77211 [Pseudocercospora fijiensis CIRAD86]